MNPYKLIIGFKTTYVNDEYVGSRLRAAIPNNAGFKFKPYNDKKTKEKKFFISERDVPSFRPPYLVAEGSDLFSCSSQDVQRFIQRLEGMGYKEFEFTREVLDIARREFAMAA